MLSDALCFSSGVSHTCIYPSLLDLICKTSRDHLADFFMLKVKGRYIDGNEQGRNNKPVHAVAVITAGRARGFVYVKADLKEGARVMNTRSQTIFLTRPIITGAGKIPPTAPSPPAQGNV